MKYQLWIIILCVLNIIYTILYYIENSKIKNAKEKNTKEENAELNKNKIKKSQITKKMGTNNNKFYSDIIY